jgi:peptidoglycan/LPS O-acetylase OafA/YrhL
MLLNVQALRGLAAFLVVFVHLETVAKLAGLPAGITVFGNSGVDVFFVISGLIMVVTTSGPKGQTPQGFLRNRLTRIAPLYWTITFAVFAIALVAPRLLQSTTADPVQLLESLAFIPYARADGEMHPVVFVGWTLNYEMAFYVIFALGLLLRNHLLGLALSIAVLVAVAAYGQIARPEGVLGFYCAPMILEFAAGMVLGALLVRDRLPKSRVWGWTAAAIGVVALAVMLAGPWLWGQFDRSVMFGIPAVVVVAAGLIAERARLVLAQGWIQTLGAASYSVYLTHFFCTQVVTNAAVRLAGLGPLAMWALALVALVLVAMVGVFVHRRVELPLTELARKVIAPMGPKPRRTIAGGAW